MKLIGAILICISSTIIGLRIGTSERTRYHTLCGLSFALDFMIVEISCKLTPLKEIFEKLAFQAPEPIKHFFHQCVLCGETRLDDSIIKIWKETAENSKFLCLKDAELQVLKEIGTTLGRYRAEEQIALLKGFQTQVESLKETAKEEQLRNRRVYRSLGITCGVALVVLLI